MLKAISYIFLISFAGMIGSFILEVIRKIQHPTSEIQIKVTFIFLIAFLISGGMLYLLR